MTEIAVPLMPQPISPPRGALSIARELEKLIRVGTFGQGQQLPTERELAQSFGASRTTVRKALTWLETQKLVERKAGSGTYASFAPHSDRGDIAERTSPLELIEVRAALEPQLAKLAVLHASARDLDKLHSLIEALEAAAKDGDGERYSDCDERFHLALASGTSNPLLIWLYEQINVIRAHDLWAEMRQKILTAENMRLYNEQHAAIVRAIQVRDALAASEHMVAHLEKARLDLIGAQSR